MVEIQQVRGAGGMDIYLKRKRDRTEGLWAQPFRPVRHFAATILYSFLLRLSAGIPPKTWPCSRKIPTGRRASQTGINSTSAMRVLLTDVSVDQQPDFF